MAGRSEERGVNGGDLDDAMTFFPFHLYIIVMLVFFWVLFHLIAVQTYASLGEPETFPQHVAGGLV